MLQLRKTWPRQYGISRAACDGVCLPQPSAGGGGMGGELFDEQIVPITIPQKKGRQRPS